MERSVQIFTNFSNGYVVEYVQLDEDGSYPDSYCRSWLLLPAENLWSPAIRGVLYIIAMIYIFIGVAIGSDIFMSSIEVITSRKRTVVIWDEERGNNISKEILIWNETVANLTLLAFGSSAPEILLATVETINQITTGEPLADEGLGFYTILGSAAFNLLFITAICIVSVPSPNLKRIRETGVFVLTAIWSLLAYLWLLAVLAWITPGVVDPWEAWLTLCFFPLLVMTAYAQDSNWWIKKLSSTVAVSNEPDPTSGKMEPIAQFINGSSINANVNGLHSSDMKQRNSANVEVMEDILSERCMSQQSQEMVDSNNLSMVLTNTCKRHPRVRFHPSLSTSSQRQYKPFARARFRHAVISSLGGSRISIPNNNPRKEIRDEPKLLSIVTQMAAKYKLYAHKRDIKCSTSATVAFGSPSYSVMENAGCIQVEVLLHRRSRTKGMLAATTTGSGESISQSSMSVNFETREGSAKINEKFKYTSGTLVFPDDVYCQTVTIPIINDEQYDLDTDFYIILRNPVGELELGDPSVARITIVDDDKPGDFLFESSQIFADMEKGEVAATVLRQNGSDGIVTVNYCTLNGTAKGGNELEDIDVDYKNTNGVLTFKHNETSKIITIFVNRNSKDTKNFVIVLSNASIGSHLGVRSATVANLNLNPDRPYPQSKVLVNEDSWKGQFSSALTVGSETDECGQFVPPSASDYALHFLTIPWKILFALVPTKTAWGGVPAFIVSLMFIGFLTAVIEQLGHLIGCVFGMKTAVTGITIIALGTSLPDTFASRTAALHDDHADASIGNITGSNCVNVFLGLGLPWVIRSSWHLANNTTFHVATTSLEFAVVIFDCFGLLSILLLLFRRYFIGGELGGKCSTKWLSGGFLVLLWMIYVIVISLRAYEYI